MREYPPEFIVVLRRCVDSMRALANGEDMSEGVKALAQEKLPFYEDLLAKLEGR